MPPTRYGFDRRGSSGIAAQSDRIWRRWKGETQRRFRSKRAEKNPQPPRRGLRDGPMMLVLLNRRLHSRTDCRSAENSRRHRRNGPLCDQWCADILESFGILIQTGFVVVADECNSIACPATNDRRRGDRHLHALACKPFSHQVVECFGCIGCRHFDRLRLGATIVTATCRTTLA